MLCNDDDILHASTCFPIGVSIRRPPFEDLYMGGTIALANLLPTYGLTSLRLVKLFGCIFAILHFRPKERYSKKWTEGEMRS